MTIVTEVPDDSKVMTEEPFHLSPPVTFKTFDGWWSARALPPGFCPAVHDLERDRRDRRCHQIRKVGVNSVAIHPESRSAASKVGRARRRDRGSAPISAPSSLEG
jgi:hypothetical protein